MEEKNSFFFGEIKVDCCLCLYLGPSPPFSSVIKHAHIRYLY